MPCGDFKLKRAWRLPDVDPGDELEKLKPGLTEKQLAALQFLGYLPGLVAAALNLAANHSSWITPNVVLINPTDLHGLATNSYDAQLVLEIPDDPDGYECFSPDDWKACVEDELRALIDVAWLEWTKTGHDRNDWPDCDVEIAIRPTTGRTLFKDGTTSPPWGRPDDGIRTRGTT